ncbi:MAG: proline hydroxylase [Proteobacteria bacterium SG_bin7]|nr:MAG: proline hydroxylase [Proteobacteria bacterium SG_bin7]
MASFFFDREDLLARAEVLRTQYKEAKPFPHVVIDNFLPEAVVEEVLTEFPKKEDGQWYRFQSGVEKKLASRGDLIMANATKHLLSQFNSSNFCFFLEKLTDIEGLIPDPHFAGGGLHQIEPGGFLKVHVDFNHYDKLRLDRRINALLYLNKNWQEEYGGHLELWDCDMKTCEKRVLPIFNRLVIFSTTSDSYHGHPDPLKCPEGMTRKSMALYYYTNGRPEEEKAKPHSTLFRERPEENFESDFKSVAKDFVPPIILKGLKKFAKSSRLN